MALNSTILAAALKSTIINYLNIDLNDPKVIEEGAEENIEEFAKAIAEEIVNHIKTYAIVSFPPGTITGACPPGGGPLSGGTGTGGKIT